MKLQRSAPLLALAVLAALSTVSCTNVPYIVQPSPPTGIEKSPDDSSVGILRLSDAELARQESLARDGNKTAAFNVYRHFRFDAGDQVAARKWLLIAAEMGHGAAQYNLAQIYLHEQDSAKAVYWAKRAKDSGYPNADALLESLGGR